MHTRSVRFTNAAVLIVMLSWGWIWQPAALGQTQMVTITSPATGAIVAGTTTVNASVNSQGVAVIEGVQFNLDGSGLGAEDITAPYSIPWNTAATSNGSHTLTAVARDTLGVRYTSDPVLVTVSNAGAVARFEEASPSITRSGVWELSTSRTWSGGTASVSTTGGSRITFTFTGPSVNWIGFLAPAAGVARVSLDGVFRADVDLYSPTEEVRAVVYTAGGLANASHTLTIEVTGLKNAAATGTTIVVDAFDVPGPTVVRVQETDPSVLYSGSWMKGNTDRAWSGGTAAESITAATTATFTFTGRSVSWIGARAPAGAIARVFLDGVFVGEVDTYSTREEIQQVVFTAGGLPSATHTLTIEMTGMRSQPATSNPFIVHSLPTIVVDAFEVTL
jgi:hypothetical protein